ncbi:MAG TPA: ADOP family duplicated permease [Terriglobales bacterium]
MIRSDAIYGLRRLWQTKVTSAAAILSLGIAIGACTSSYRLLDALLLRPLAVAHPERLYSVAYQSADSVDGRPSTYDSNSYPEFLRMKAAVQDHARMVAVSYADRSDLTYGGNEEMEKAFTQYISGDMFSVFGLRPALGRLFGAGDDGSPGAHPVAVIAYAYWTARFGRDRSVIGRTFRMGDGLFQIVGVAPEGFAGTETGLPVDVFLPMAMKTRTTLESWNNFWLRALVELNPGVAPSVVRESLSATHRAVEEQRAQSMVLTPSQRRALFKDALVLAPAGSGRSNLQRDYRDSLIALAVLVGLVLLIAAANLANLMNARGVERAREMAIRQSLGASGARLLQLVLIESAWIAAAAMLAGVGFSNWATPTVAGWINGPDTPIHLSVPLDGRVWAFSLGVALLVTLLFGLPPALRMRGGRPAVSLRGGNATPQRRRLMQAWVSAQVAFCIVVVLVAGMFVRSLDQLSRQPLGYHSDGVLNLESVARPALPAVYWGQVAERLRSVPGVASVAIAGWPLMNGESANSAIAVHGVTAETFADRYGVSPGWFQTMGIPLVRGRDFRPGEAVAFTRSYGPAIVNESFARQYFGGLDPLGRTFTIVDGRGGNTALQVVGVVGDARYRDNLRLALRPMFYLPFGSSAGSAAGPAPTRGTFVIRAAPGVAPLTLASALRAAVVGARPELRVSNVLAQTEIVASKTIRQRVLALLGLFFGGVAVLLAAVGLYGVLEYSVRQRRRELGIRMALGARGWHIAGQVVWATFMMVGLGAAFGIGAGIACARYFAALFYGVRAADAGVLGVPLLLLGVTAGLAALPAVLRALAIDPAAMLRSE